MMLVVGDSFVSPSDLQFLWRTSWLFCKGSFGVHLNSTSYDPLITADIDLIHDLVVFNDLGPVARSMVSVNQR